jgi:hypothetical protein
MRCAKPMLSSRALFQQADLAPLPPPASAIRCPVRPPSDWDRASPPPPARRRRRSARWRRAACGHGGCTVPASRRRWRRARGRRPRAARATSACGSPAFACQPSPTTAPALTTTQPTRGFGVVVYRPRAARRSARAMYSWSWAEYTVAWLTCRLRGSRRGSRRRPGSCGRPRRSGCRPPCRACAVRLHHHLAQSREVTSRSPSASSAGDAVTASSTNSVETGRLCKARRKPSRSLASEKLLAHAVGLTTCGKRTARPSRRW